MNTCVAAHSPWTAPGNPVVVVTCIRPVDKLGRHKGAHQGWQAMPAGIRKRPDWAGGDITYDAWDRLWEWTAGGSVGYTNMVGKTCLGCQDQPARRNKPFTHKPEDHTWLTCGLCGCLYDRWGYHRHGDYLETPEACFQCRLWWQRAEVYAGRLPAPRNGHRLEQRMVVPHPYSPRFATTGRIYTWSPKVTGAFGGWACRVTWDDGMTVGPSSCLWDGGTIPWWHEADFPPNGIIENGYPS